MIPRHLRARSTTRPAIPARPPGPAVNVFRPEKSAATRTTDDTTPDPDPAAPAGDYDRPIPYYTRADAIADGLLVEVPRRLCEQFRLPAQTVITDQLWADAIATAAHPKPPAPTTRPPWPADGLPDEVRGRLVDLLWLTHAYRETDPGRPLAMTFVLWRVPARLAPSAGENPADPIRVTCTVHAGDCGETVATLSHAFTDTAGTFHLEGDPDRQWPAVRFDPDAPDGCARPVVTVETLAAMLTAAAGTNPADPPDVEANWTHSYGWVHVATAGKYRTLKPADGQRGIYPLGPLGWPLRRSPTDQATTH